MGAFGSIYRRYDPEAVQGIRGRSCISEQPGDGEIALVKIHDLFARSTTCNDCYGYERLHAKI